MANLEHQHDHTAQEQARVSLPPVLVPGDHLDQKEFHRRYVEMPEDVKAELIGGVVYMPASLGRSHGRSHSQLMLWLTSYEVATHGVEVYDNATTIMGEDSEPQPDACLIIHPDKGGQMRFTKDDYLEGAPELVGEVATSSEAYDLHSKKRDYETMGVQEYVVVALRQKKVFWFVNQDNVLTEKPVDSDNIHRSEVFPGLWLDPQALLALNGARLLDVLQRGLNTEEHIRFVKRLAKQ